MHSKFHVIGLIAVFVGLFIFSCGHEDPVEMKRDQAFTKDPGDQYLLGQGHIDTCYTASCINSFLLDCDGMGTLVVMNDNDPYILGDYYFVSSQDDECKVIIKGNDESDPSELELTNAVDYPKYGSLHFAGNGFCNLENIILHHNIQMGSGQSPGIMFEVEEVNAYKVKFISNSGSGDTYFMGGLITFNDCELSSGHYFNFGPEDWCGPGVPVCGGFGGSMAVSGSEIKNSKLYGKIIFDVVQTDYEDTTKFYFRNNNPITSIDLNVEEGSKVKVIFSNNTFAQSTGAIVDVSGDFKVDAWANTTQKGPCYSDAISDFDISNSNLGDNAVTLTSWKYDGALYSIPEIENLDYYRNGNTVTVTWNTDHGATSIVQWGYSCGALDSTATGIVAMLHCVQFTVPSDEGCIYLRAISANPGCSCDADTSDCEVNVQDVAISNVNSSRNGNTVTVTWTTNYSSSSKVIWGTSCSQLSHSATGSDGTQHSVQFNVLGDEGCHYYKAISASSCSADTSNCEVNTEDIAISYIQTSFSPFLCQYTVTWTTNVKSSSKVYYGESCQNLNNAAIGAGNTTSHSVVCDVNGFGSVFAFKVESANSCDSAQSNCQTDHKDVCFGQ